MRYVSSIVAIATLAVAGCEANGPVPHATRRCGAANHACNDSSLENFAKGARDHLTGLNNAVAYRLAKRA